MASPRCWIGVAARSHALQGQSDGFVMFAHGRHEAVKRLSPGDWFTYYAPGETLDRKQPVRRFVCIGTIAEGEPEHLPMTATVWGWRRAARYLEAQEADIYPLLPRLSFITDPAHWGMAFRRSLFSVSPEDFRIIADAMGVGTTFTKELQP